MRKKQRFSLLAILLFSSFFIIAVVVGMVVALDFKKQTNSWLISILFGAICGFFVSWLFFFSIAKLYEWLILGGPFRVGDRVEIIYGPHKAKTGTILSIDKAQGFIRIDLDDQSNKDDNISFGRYEFRRLGNKKNT